MVSLSRMQSFMLSNIPEFHGENHTLSSQNTRREVPVSVLHATLASRQKAIGSV